RDWSSDVCSSDLVFGLPRLVTNKENMNKLLDLVDNRYHGLTLCSGSLGSNPEIDIPDLIRSFDDRIHFAHIRNVHVFDNGSFIETSHRTQDGPVHIYGIMKAYHDVGFPGYVCPDTG